MAEGAETHHQQQPSSNSPPFSSSTPSNSDQSLPESQGMDVSGSQNPQNAIPQMFPMVSSSIVAPQQDQEQNGYGPGLYAVPCSPYMGRLQFPPSTLIPLNYKIPTRTNSANAVGEQEGQGQEAGRQLNGPQRQVVGWQFQFALQLDLGLLLKLVAVVILFGQEGSKQRFFLLVGFAFLVYLYQTGALTPLIQYLRRAAGPLPPPRHAENHGIARRPEDNAAGVENQNQPAEAEVAPAGNGNQQEHARGNGINWMGIAREIQTFIVGFVASLLPGFHHNE